MEVTLLVQVPPRQVRAIVYGITQKCQLRHVNLSKSRAVLEESMKSPFVAVSRPHREPR